MRGWLICVVIVGGWTRLFVGDEGLWRVDYHMSRGSS